LWIDAVAVTSLLTSLRRDKRRRWLPLGKVRADGGLLPGIEFGLPDLETLAEASEGKGTEEEVLRGLGGVDGGDDGLYGAGGIALLLAGL